MIVRPFTPADLTDVAVILTMNGMQPDLPVTIMSDIQPELCPIYYVAEDEGEIVGGGGMFVIRDVEHPVGWLASVAVSKARKRSGVGSAIVKANLEHAHRLGYGSMWLETYFWNTKFYESLGFEGIKPPLVPEPIRRWRSQKRCRVMVNTGCAVS